MRSPVLGHAAAGSNARTVVEGEFVAQTSILLADVNPTVLDHVRKLLQNDKQYRVVATVNDGDAVLRECYRLKPDVVILDIFMGELSGIDVARELRNCGNQSKIVFLTVHEDQDFLNAAMGAGGSAYVVKSRVDLDLLSAVDAVLCDKLFVSSSLMYEGR